MKFDFDENVFYYAGVEIDGNQIKKAILSACGGNYTETYFRLLSMPIKKLFDMLNLFSEYQQEQEKMMKERR
ncbi:hypothetical protein [Dolichospermum phage Dfl-JY23]